MSAFQDQQAEHLANVFRNTDHFAGEFQFCSRDAEPIDFVGILDEDDLKLKDTDEQLADVIDAKMRCVDVTLADQMHAEGWIPDGSRLFFIVGQADRDANCVTLLLALTNAKTVRVAYPHGSGRTLKHK